MPMYVVRCDARPIERYKVQLVMAGASHCAGRTVAPRLAIVRRPAIGSSNLRQCSMTQSLDLDTEGKATLWGHRH